jgi:hypothetical protein
MSNAKEKIAPAAKQDDGFVDVPLDTFQYKIGDERCRKHVLQGYLIDYVKMPPADRDENPDWECFVFRLTAPCVGIDREKKPHSCIPGDIVLLSVPAKLRDRFGRTAINPSHVTEVRFGDWTQVDIGGGKKMWSPAIAKENPKTVKARLGFCPLPVGPNVDPSRLLAAKNGSSTSDVDEVPFG